VLKGINLTVAAGEFVTLLGSSGCGKTTFANALSGLIKSKNSRGIVNNGGKVEISKGDFIVNGNNSIGILNKGNNVISSEDVFIISGNNSAGILATKESEVTNAGRIEGNTGTNTILSINLSHQIMRS